MKQDRLELLASISSLYFEEHLSQSDIAARTGYSPSMISRLLTEAREKGVVEIRVHHPIQRRVDLEKELQHLLGLKMARVVVCGPVEHSQMLRRLGAMAARLIEASAQDNMTIGTSWGTAVYETVAALRMHSDFGVNVVQMIGSLDTPNPEISGPELTQRLARILTGHYSILPAPLLVDSKAMRDGLLNDSRVRRVVSRFSTIQLALVGVGTLEPESESALSVAGYLTHEHSEELKAAGAVGDVCAVFVDLEGRLVQLPLSDRVVGIDAEALRAIPNKVGVAGGDFKVKPIIGASRAGLINILVTDDVTARGIVRQLQEDKSDQDGKQRIGMD